MYCLAWIINLWCCASLTLHEGLRRRQDAGIKPEMIQAVVESLVDGVGKQMDTVLKKARELDQKQGTKEQKMGELEAEINQTALAMSEKLAEQKKEPAKEPAKGPVMDPIKDNYTPSPGSPDSITPEPKKAPAKEEYKDENEPKEESSKSVTKSSGNMSPEETKKFISEIDSDMEQMKKEMKEDMQDLKKELGPLRRRQLPEGVFFDREGANQAASQAASQITNNLSQNPFLAPFAANIQQTADGIANQAVQNLANSFQ